MDKKEAGRQRKDTIESAELPKSSGNMKAFMKFRETLEKEIESALLEKMRAFRDEILRSRLK